MGAHLTKEQRQLAFRLRHRGLSTSAIAKEVGLTYDGMRVVLRGQKRDGRPDEWTSALGRLSVHEREEILLGLHHGLSMRAIARALGRAPSTVTREVAANGGRESYRIWPAHQRARACTKRPKSAKLDDPVLCEKVTTWLEEFWSPDEISRRLRREFPSDPTMQISHETIYQSLYVQGRGELRRELAGACARVEPNDVVKVSSRPAERSPTW